MAKMWRQEEIEYLYEHVGSVRVEVIAKNLDKPINGVLIKMKRLNIGKTKDQLGLLTMGGLANLLQVDRNTVKNWVNNHQLPVTKRKTRTTKVFYFIEPTNFWDWAFKHQDRIDFSKVEENAIPPEPDWVKPLRYQKREIKGNYYRSWTTKEEQMVLELRGQGLTYKEIGKVMNRTALSVEKKYKRLISQTTLLN